MVMEWYFGLIKITYQTLAVVCLPVLRVVGELLFAAYLLEYFFADVLQFVIWQVFRGSETRLSDKISKINVFCTVLGRCHIADR